MKDLKLSERFMYYCGILSVAGASVDDLKHIQNLIDLEEQGLLIILPCKVGDTVWLIDDECIKDDECWELGECETCKSYVFKIREANFNVDFYDWIGKTVFLTKEEALAKLKELQNE